MLGHLVGDRDIPSTDEQRSHRANVRFEPGGNPPLDAAQISLGGNDVLLTREQKGHIDRHAREMVDGGKALPRTRDLDEKIRASRLDMKGLGRGDRAGRVVGQQRRDFYAGGVLVPLDYKLTAVEHLQLLAHSKAKVLVVEYYLWRAIMQAPDFHDIKTKLVLVTEAPLGADLAGGFRWEDFRRKGAPDFVMRQREDVACIVYSSGTGGRPKGCVLTHENYLEQCRALTAWYPFWPGVRYLSILPTNHAIDFMVGFIGPFVCGACVVHLRTLRPEFVRDAFLRYRITYVSLVPMIVSNT